MWSSDKVELWRYRSDRRTIAPAAAVRAQPRSTQLRVRPRARQQLRRVHARPRASTCSSSTGACPTSSRPATRSRPTATATSRRRRRGSAQSRQRDVNVFGYCFGGVLSLLSLAGNPDVPVRSLAVMATPIDFRQMGPMTSMLQEGRVDPERPARRHRQRAGRRDAQLVPGAASRPATSPATSTCGRTSGTTTSSRPTRR